MSERHIFHLSIPVSELAPAKRFYVEVINARTGRENDEWLDVLLWGIRLRCNGAPKKFFRWSARASVTLASSFLGRSRSMRRRAFGPGGFHFYLEPAVLLSGTSEEQAKFYLQDTSHNVIEVKAYRNLADTLGTDGN